MCGIAGAVSPKGLSDVTCNNVVSLLNSLYHRGPDGEGKYVDHSIMMVMRRLAINDLEGGWQPLYNEDKSIVLVANGEIYNHLELRKHLEDRGHKFHTKSDCEVILHLYEEKGESAVQDLRGMFAFALWDIKRKKFFLVRDRLGEKPLYLYEENDVIYFSSELRSFIKSNIVYPELSKQAVLDYFYYNYIPEPSTAIIGIRKLPAGTILEIDMNTGERSERRYWNLLDSPPCEENPIIAIKSELERVSELILRSDVPIGVALSGGVDSSLIAALVARHSKKTIHAFSVGYEGRMCFDERNDAKKLSKTLGFTFNEVEITLKQARDSFCEMIRSRDDPIADLSGISYFSLMRACKEAGVPVLLLGHGGDELFWGYQWCIDAVHASVEKNIVLNGKSNFSRFIQPQKRKFPNIFSQSELKKYLASGFGLLNKYRYKKIFKKSLYNPDELIFYDLSAPYQQAEQGTAQIFSTSFLGEIGDLKPPSRFFNCSGQFDRPDLDVTDKIISTYLLGNGLVQGDRLSMACSVESRVPFVDYKFIETVVGLRKHQTDINLPHKAWLREVAKDYLPDEVLNRQKRGFTSPFWVWCQEIFNSYGYLLKEGYLVSEGILDPKAAAQMSYGPSRSSVGRLALRTLMLEVWTREILIGERCDSR